MVSLNSYCRYSFFLLLVLSLLSINAYAADQFIKTMTVATTIDKNKFYSPEIDVYFEDKILYPTAVDGKFQNVSTNLVVEATNYIDSYNLNHTLYLTKNLTTCYAIDTSNAGVVSEILESQADYPNYPTTFVRTYVNGLSASDELTETSPIIGLAFLTNDSVSQIGSSRYPFTLVFKETLPLPNTIECKGEIQVMVEFDG